MNFKSFSNNYRKISGDINFYAFLIIAPSLFFSRFLISLGFIFIVVNSIVEGNYKAKFAIIKNNKASFYIMLLWLFHLLGLLNTQIIESGIYDIRLKSFLFIILAYGSSVYLSNKHKNIVFYLYILSALVASLISSFKFYWTNEPTSIEDLGGIAFLGGNLYQAILVSFAISLLCYFIIFNKNKKLNLIYYITTSWFIIYLFLLNSLTGYVLITTIFFYNALYLFVKLDNLKSKIKVILVFLVIISSASIYISLIVKDFYNIDDVNYSQLAILTANGNIYEQDTINKESENGHFLYLNYCKKELEREWNKRSDIFYTNLDNKNQLISKTITRYLSSKNLTKDSIGISKLNNRDIKLIESGCANYLYAEKYNAKARIYIVLWQLDSYFNNNYANRQTISQRIVYMDAAIELIKNNFWWGVGPGDVSQISKEYLAKHNSGLSKEYSFHVHNQFLVEFLGLGVFGFIAFIFIIFYPYYKNKMWKDYLLTSFFIIFVLSFFSENLFETQLGITFFAYFYSILVFNRSSIL